MDSAYDFLNSSIVKHRMSDARLVLLDSIFAAVVSELERDGG